MRTDTIWQSQALVDSFLTGVRGGIPFALEQINLALRFLDQTGHRIHRVADLGCGDGAIAQAVLNHYPQAQVTAIDFSEPMLEQAKQRLQPYGDRVTFLQADLYHPDWQQALDVQSAPNGQSTPDRPKRPAPFDAILSGYCIHHLPDERKIALYNEIYHLLTPGGSFLNIEHVVSASPWLETLFNEVLVESLYQWHQSQGKGLSKEEVAQKFVYRDDKDANILAPVETQCQWLREIGFQQVDCYFKIFELAVFGGIRPSSKEPFLGENT